MASVILDAGHGGYDNGASFDGRLEKEDALNLVLAVGDRLQEKGIDVLYTRTEDVYQSPIQKARIANESGADYFVSIHRNSSPQPDTYSGVQTLVYADEGIPAVFAQNINRALEAVGYANLGTSVRPNLVVLRRTNMPAVLVEAGFINTAADNLLFDTRFDQTAQAIADGIEASIRQIEQVGVAVAVSSKETTTKAGTDRTVATEDTPPVADSGIDAADIAEGTSVTKADSTYHVVTGVFSQHANAAGLARLMQKEGIDAYIQQRGDHFWVCHGNYRSEQEAQQAERELYELGYETNLLQTS